MIHYKRVKATKYQFEGNKDCLEELRYLAACNLLTYNEHTAGNGSFYIFIGTIKIRFSDHVETSKQHQKPDFNIVNRNLNKRDLDKIKSKLVYPEYIKQRVFSLCVNQTIPKLKKSLSDECYEEIVENPYYPNTKTRMINVKKAFEELEMKGIKEKSAVRQGLYSVEDYVGY